MATGLPGRKGGPQDAFRHAYASAVVARYISPDAVLYINEKWENDKNSPHDKMDRHNNRVGMNIGESGFSIAESVNYLILQSNTQKYSDDDLYWLDESEWSDGF